MSRATKKKTHPSGGRTAQLSAVMEGCTGLLDPVNIVRDQSIAFTAGPIWSRNLASAFSVPSIESEKKYFIEDSMTSGLVPRLTIQVSTYGNPRTFSIAPVSSLPAAKLRATRMPIQSRTLSGGRPKRDCVQTRPKVSNSVEQTAIVPWTKNEVVGLWKKYHYETRLKHVSHPLTDEDVVNQLVVQTLPRETALSLFSAWVEIVHQQAFRLLQKDYLPEENPCVLYLPLDNKFMPEGKLEIHLACWANQKPEQAQGFLRGLHEWAVQKGGEHPLGSLGWLICLPNRPGLILCWDELLPHARYRKYLTQSIPGEVLAVNGKNLTLKVIPNDGPPREVNYEVHGFEASGLEPRDRIRYWEDIEGQSLVLSENPLSPYLVTGQRKQERRDEYAYTLTPVDIG